MKHILYFSFGLVMAMFFAISVDAAVVTKAQGDQAYIKGNYQTAIDTYEALLQQGEAADIYYNLGNSYYKTKQMARAVLNYERALLLQPGNADIRANLDIARSKTIDKVYPAPDIFFIAWFKALINWQSTDVWAVCGVISFILLLVSLYFFIFSKTLTLKKTGFVCGIVMVCLTVITNIFAYQQKLSLTSHNNAIVMSHSVVVRSTPSDSGTSLFVIHEGRKVGIKDNTMKAWREISLEDGKVGWVPAETLEVI